MDLIELFFSLTDEEKEEVIEYAKNIKEHFPWEGQERKENP